MGSNDLQALLEQVRLGHIPVADAVRALQAQTVADLGYAHVDLQRQQRCGFPEVIFCEGKTSEWVEGVVRKLNEAGQDSLATRVSPEQAEHLTRQFPQGEQDRLGRTFWLPVGPRSAPLNARRSTLRAPCSRASAAW